MRRPVPAAKSVSVRSGSRRFRKTAYASADVSPSFRDYALYPKWGSSANGGLSCMVKVRSLRAGCAHYNGVTGDIHLNAFGDMLFEVGGFDSDFVCTSRFIRKRIGAGRTRGCRTHVTSRCIAGGDASPGDGGSRSVSDTPQDCSRNFLSDQLNIEKQTQKEHQPHSTAHASLQRANLDFSGCDRV